MDFRMEVLRLAKAYDVEVVFKDLPYGGRVSRRRPRQIDLSTGIAGLSLLQCFFHELGHVHCLRTGLWRNYHWVDICHWSGLRAEKWVDDWAALEMAKHTSLPYNKLYHTSYGVDFHRNRVKEVRKLKQARLSV